jgi:hypothetical protein
LNQLLRYFSDKWSSLFLRAPVKTGKVWTTLYPRFRNASTSPAPIPREAPVTIAVFAVFDTSKLLLLTGLLDLNRCWWRTVLLREPSLIPLLKNSSSRNLRSSRLPPSDHTRRVEARQLDEGIVDTFVSVGVKNGAHTSVSISASDSARIPRAAHLELLLDELANLVSFRLRLVEPQLAGSNYSRGFEWTGLI